MSITRRSMLGWLGVAPLAAAAVAATTDEGARVAARTIDEPPAWSPLDFRVDHDGVLSVDQTFSPDDARRKLGEDVWSNGYAGPPPPAHYNCRSVVIPLIRR